jgi:hypothetical protein
VEAVSKRWKLKDDTQWQKDGDAIIDILEAVSKRLEAVYLRTGSFFWPYS